MNLRICAPCGRVEPWSVADAPVAFVAGQIRVIVGIEIPITRIAGRWKMSRNHSEADRRFLVDGMRADGALAPAEAVAARSPA